MARKTGHHPINWLLGAALLCLCTCDNNPENMSEDDHRFEGAQNSLDGSVFYRERIALPRNATVEVELVDITDPAAPRVLLSSGPIHPQGGPPHNFQIPIQLANLDMEKLKSRQYGLRATIHSDGRLMFANEGYVHVDDGDPKRILVERLEQPASADKLALEGTHWGLHTLGETFADYGVGGRQIDIRLIAAESRAAGFSGCNRFSSSYTLAQGDGGTLSFGPIAGTRMACPTGRGDIETSYLEMLGKVTAYRLREDTLVFLAGDEILASFKAM